MKCLLIHPNLFAERYISIGIGMISAVLKASGHQVSFFDTSRYGGSNPHSLSTRQEQKMSSVLQFKSVELPPVPRSPESVFDALNQQIRHFKPNLIGISATSSEIPYTRKIANFLKPYCIPVILGGAHPTVEPEDSINIDGVDMIMRGEGEKAIIELADAIDNGHVPRNIRNIWFKKELSVIKNPVRPYIRDLDSLPFIDLDIFDTLHSIGAYQGQMVNYGRFESGRGCPYDCTYCINRSLHALYHEEKRHVRMHSPERVIKELVHGIDRLHFDVLRMLDETFLAATPDWLKLFANLNHQHIDRPLVITTRPETVSEKKLKILRQATDNIQITMGIESGSERIRKQVCGRKHSNKTIIDAFHQCRNMGFLTAAFNMIGLPGETREDFLETIEINRQAEVDQPMLSYFYPFPGTELRDKCILKGYIEDKIHEVDYAVTTKLNMPEFTADEINGLKRTFVMYVKMDRTYFPEIKNAESNDRAFEKLSHEYIKNFLN